MLIATEDAALHLGQREVCLLWPAVNVEAHHGSKGRGQMASECSALEGTSIATLALHPRLRELHTRGTDRTEELEDEEEPREMLSSRWAIKVMNSRQLALPDKISEQSHGRINWTSWI